MKISKNCLKNLTTGLIGFVCGFGLGYWGNKGDVNLDNNPLFGSLSQKDSFPDYFYGRKINPEELKPSIKDAYFRGFIEGDLVLKVLDGQILNVEPQFEKRTF